MAALPCSLKINSTGKATRRGFRRDGPDGHGTCEASMSAMKQTQVPVRFTPTTGRASMARLFQFLESLQGGGACPFDVAIEKVLQTTYRTRCRRDAFRFPYIWEYGACL